MALERPYSPLSFKSYARNRLGCILPCTILKTSSKGAFLFNADVRLSIPCSRFFTDSVFISIGICIKPVDLLSVVFFKLLQNNIFKTFD